MSPETAAVNRLKIYWPMLVMACLMLLTWAAVAYDVYDRHFLVQWVSASWFITIALSWIALTYVAYCNRRDARAFSTALRKEQGAAARLLAEEAQDLIDGLKLIRQMLDVDLDKEEIAACEYPLLQLPNNLESRTRWKTTTHVAVFAFQIMYTCIQTRFVKRTGLVDLDSPIKSYQISDTQPQPTIHDVVKMLICHKEALLAYAARCSFT